MLFSAASASAQDGTRTVSSNEPGNCIFSTDVMPNGQFSHPAYKKVKTLFQVDEVIAGRCFYEEGSQQSYFSRGKVANTMRDAKRYFVELEWMNPRSTGSFKDYTVKSAYHNVNAGWDQQRYAVSPNFSDCNFKFSGSDIAKNNARPNGCVDFAGFIRSQKIPDPGQEEFCIRVYMKFADAWTYRTIGGTTRKEPEYLEKTMARGCFKIDFTGAGLAAASGQSSGPQAYTEALAQGNQESAGQTGYTEPTPETEPRVQDGPRVQETERKKREKIRLPRVKKPKLPF